MSNSKIALLSGWTEWTMFLAVRPHWWCGCEVNHILAVNHNRFCWVWHWLATDFAHTSRFLIHEITEPQRGHLSLIDHGQDTLCSVKDRYIEILVALRSLSIWIWTIWKIFGIWKKYLALYFITLGDKEWMNKDWDGKYSADSSACC